MEERQSSRSSPKAVHALLGLLGLGLCAYGLHCVLHMWAYIGTPEYFTNAWFWKAHITLLTVMGVSATMKTLRIKR